MLKKYMNKQIRRWLSNPAVLVIALVYLSSCRRAKPVFHRWATQAL